jgi:ubiquinol-cytochrome c reductase cytochrome c1 subunit
MKKILAKLILIPALAVLSTAAWANTEKTPLEKAPVNLHDKVSLQRGAQIFVNHCLNCHAAASMRYARLTDIGLDEAQIRDNLVLAGEKVGESMTTALTTKDGKAFFGVAPPDLSLIARSRGPDWIYTYLKGFYKDPTTKSGWNNTVFPNVGMPHVLWEYQGDQRLEVTERMDPNTGDKIETRRLVLDRPGSLTPVQYDQYLGDLVSYLAYMAEPSQSWRKQWGVIVLFVMAAFFVATLLLKMEFWKDVR